MQGLSTARPSVAATVIMSLLWVGACKPSPPANPSFDDAAQFAFREFENDDPAVLAYAIREFEAEIYRGVNVEASVIADRSLTPADLSEEDLEGLEHPDRDITLAVPVAVAAGSVHELTQHQSLPVLLDQRPLEPNSPDHYDRTFLDDSDSCWPDRSCAFLRTENVLTKTNLLMTLSYTLYKDFRWVDLNLPDPADVADGEDTTNEGEPRWAFVARSWTSERAEEDGGGSSIEQSYSFEVWIPRDSQGFIRSSAAENNDNGDWTADSTAGGTLRLMSLWAESDLGVEVTEDTVVFATRSGIDDIFEAQEDYLDGSSN